MQIKTPSLKPSRFNLQMQVKNKTCIYNCATGKWAWFSPADAAGITENRSKALDDKIRKTALAAGILINTAKDETKWYENAYQVHTRNRAQAFYVMALSFKCNLKCHYCFEKNGGFSTDSIQAETLNRLISAVKQRCLADKTRNLGIMLFGGEPLLELEKHLFLLKNLTGWCRDQGIAFMGNISTNGSLLTEKNVDLLKPYINSAQVTFDGPKSIHDRIRITHGDKPTFDKIVRGIKLLQAEKINVTIRAQVDADSPERLFALIDELKQASLLAPPHVKVSIGMLRNFSKWSACSQRQNHVEPGSDMERRLMALSETILPVQRPAVQILPCITAGNMLCVDPRGNLYKCVTSLTDPTRRVGHLNSDSKFVFTPHYRQFYDRKPWLLDDCRKCALLPHCGGGCPKSTLQRHGTYQHSYCGNTKTLLKHRIEKMILTHASNVKN